MSCCRRDHSGLQRSKVRWCYCANLKRDVELIRTNGKNDSRVHVSTQPAPVAMLLGYQVFSLAQGVSASARVRQLLKEKPLFYLFLLSSVSLGHNVDIFLNSSVHMLLPMRQVNRLLSKSPKQCVMIKFLMLMVSPAEEGFKGGLP